ncbi:MAG: hypothetical protein NTV73_06050 [Hyphomicrobiales bacterium]|nr:hypothetical protein [Hyphomicrobiales bacterium]
MRRLPLMAGSLLAAIAAAGCSSTQDVLEPSAIAAAPPALGELQTETAGRLPVQAASANTSAALNPGIASRTRLRFDPIVGATVDVAAPLTERLAQRARSRGIALAGSNDPAATHVLKGYFSTLTEGGQTTVIYVWDVYDPAGNRLHRINGQQKAPAGGGEGWAAVPPATMQAIADSTVDQIVSWLASSSG